MFGVGVDFLQLGFDVWRVIAQAGGIAEDFGQVHRGDGDAGSLQDFFAVANGLERTGAGANGSQPGGTQSFDNTADAHEFLQILFEQLPKLDGWYAGW